MIEPSAHITSERPVGVCMHINYHGPTMFCSLKGDHRRILSKIPPSHKEGAISPATMVEVLGPSTTQVGEGAGVPVSQGEKSKQPRKVPQPKTPENKEQSPPDVSNDSQSVNAPGMLVQNASTGPASLGSVQGGRGADQSELREDGEYDQAIFSTPETIHYSLESDTDPEAVVSGVEQTDHIATYVTTTTTEVEERKSTDTQKTEQFSTVGERTQQPRRDVSTLSRTIPGQQRYEVQSSVQGGVQRKASFYQETHFPSVTEPGQSPNIFSSTSKAIETRRVMVPSKSTYSSVRDQFLQIERLHREEKDRILSLMTAEHEEYKRLCEEQLGIYQMENEGLLQEVSASASRITLLEIQLNSLHDGYPGTGSQSDKVDSAITTITTTITSITTTITTVTTRIAQWKHAVARNKGQITISSKELEQLSSDLSTTSSQMTELQRHYAELSRNFGSLRHELQVASSLRDQKDRTISSLTAEVAHWENANETLRRDLSVTSSRATELQQRHEAQSGELSSLRNELRTRASLIEEKDRTIASFAAEVAQWKQSEATKAEQISRARRDCDRLQRDLSASSSQIAELQKRYDAQSKELGVVRNELQTSKSLTQEQDRVITTLTAEVDQWKRADAVKAEQLATEHRDKEKLQQDLTAFSSQTADLRKRYDAQSKEIVSVRNELQTKVSLLEEKEHVITSLTNEVTQVKREDNVKVGQITIARKEVEQLRGELSSSSSWIADLQKRYEAQSQELDTVRNELHQIEILYPDGTDQAPGKPSKNAVSQHIARALEKKSKQMEELRRDLSASTSRNTELQRSYEVLSREVSAVRDELKVTTSQNEGTIASLTGQVDQWKRADATKAEQIATTLRQVEKLRHDISTSTSQLAELQGRYEVQSREFITVRKDLQTLTSSNESKDSTISTITAELNQWKRADVAKAEQIATTLKQVEELQRDLSTSTSQLAEFQGRYKAQSHELASVRKEFQTGALSNEDKDRTVAALTAQVEEWKRVDALKEERILTARKQAEDLQRELTNSSQIAKLQQRYEVQSRELGSLREQLQAALLGKDHAVSSLTSQVEEWKHLYTSKAEELRTACKDLEQLRGDLAGASSQLAEFQERDRVRLTEFGSRIEGWKRADATKTEELTAARKDLEQLRHDLSTSSSQIIEYQQRYAARSAELTSRIEESKRSDAAKAEELATARKRLEQLRLDLSTSSSRIIEFQDRCEAQSTELDSLREQLKATLSLDEGKDHTIATLHDRIKQLKRGDAVNAEELAHARRDLEQLQRQLSASSSQIDELQKHHAAQLEVLGKSTFVSKESREVYKKVTSEVKDYTTIIKLTTTVDEWLRADAKRAEVLALELAKRNQENEELRHNLVTLKEIYIRAPELKQIFESETLEIQQRYEEQSRELQSALAERQSQLDGVQRFVTTADTYADTMIIQMIQKLNAEVQQSTTFMSECIIEDFRPRSTKLTKEQNSAVQRVSDSIGQALVDCLGRKERDDVALFLPIAFQAYLTYYLRWIISSWTIEKGRDDIINEIYERLQKSEAQPISGRWRSLTRTYILPTCITDPNTLISSTVAGLSDIAVTASCATTTAAATSKISSKFEAKVSSIISIAGRFSKMIGEVVSGDFEVMAVRPAQIFEEITMEEDVDDYGGDLGTPGQTAAGQRVLCSTQLGMTKRMQLESGKKETLTVIKAKVLFESFLDD